MALGRDGAEIAPGAIAVDRVRALESVLGDVPPGPGHRLVDRPDLAEWIQTSGLAIDAGEIIGRHAFPVRAILFDKSEASNWSLGWHQDRTIAVAERTDLPGYDRWTTKDSIIHVEPPFPIIERMVSVRIHLDDVPETNAPLLVIAGSHLLGRLEESEIEALVSRSAATACLASVGDAWWFKTAIVHASARAVGNRRRRVLQVDFSSDELPHPLRWRGIA